MAREPSEKEEDVVREEVCASVDTEEVSEVVVESASVARNSANSSPNSSLTHSTASEMDMPPPMLPVVGLVKRTSSAKEISVTSGLTPPPLNRSKTTVDGQQQSTMETSPKLHTSSMATTPTSTSYASSTLQNQIEIAHVTIPADAIKEVEEEKHTHTVFSLEVRLVNGLRWIIEKRYSDFREFHERMKKANPSVRNLNFPKRQIFRMKSTAAIEQRRADLEKYLKDILAVQPLMKVPIFNFLAVYAHLESYDRKKRRQQKEIELRRMKNLLPTEELDDIEAAFQRLCSSKHSNNESSDDKTNDSTANTPTQPSNGTLLVTGPLSSIGSMAQLLDSKENISISKTAFRRDVLSVFPDMPSTFAMRFIKGVSDKQHNDISMDEFVRAIAILRHGSLEDRLTFAFHMCDHDHMGKLQSTGLGNLLICINGRAIADKLEYKRLLNDVFDYGRARLAVTEFIAEIQKQSSCSLIIDWMPQFIDILCESANPKLLELQEEYNPVVQQKILESETHFTVKDISLLQDAFHAYRSSNPDEQIDVEALANDFPLDMSDSRLLVVFSSFGPRANGNDVDIFSFVHALSIACRGTTEEKMNFGFKIFLSEPTRTSLNHEDLFAMLQLEVLKHTNIASTISHYMKECPETSESSRNLLRESTVLSSAQLGVYVDHILEAFGADDELNFDQFCTWSKAVSFQVASLDRMKQAVFGQTGLIPMNKQEEIDVAKLCYHEYNPAELVEDDNWYIIEQTWYDHWRKYVGFVPMVEVRGNPKLSRAASSPSKGSTANSPASNGKMSLLKHNKPAGASTPPAVKDETPSSILDSDKNVIRPKYIANATLLNKEKIFCPTDDHYIGKHFVVVHEQLWLGLKQWYGGGPEIKKTVIVLANGQTTLNLWNSEVEKHDAQSEDATSTSIIAKPTDGNTNLKRVRAGASVGLVNLGNTCYMNSALQCIGNTPLLVDYFLSGMYINDINRTSTLGMQGKLAEVYGKLAEDMWSAKYKSISPREFKKTIGKFNEAFRGSDQQDAQELIAFLLSGLSEDLNRILDKPYIEHPDSDGRFDADLADEWWRNSLKREVSIIVALFTGQYKSLLTCSHCGYKSARFEPFTFLQLPLPEPTHNNVTIRLAFASGRMPLKLSLRLPIDATVLDLKKHLADMCVSEFELPMTTIADIKICEYQGSLILGFKADNRKLAQIRSIDRLLAFQLEPLSSRILEMTRTRRPSLLTMEMPSGQPTAPEAPPGMTAIYVTEGTLIEVQVKGDYVPATILSIESPELVSVQYKSGDCESNVPHSRLRQRLPRLLYCPVVSRKLGYSPAYFKNPFRPVPFGTPDLIRLCPEYMTGFELYTMVWQRVQKFLKKGLSPPVEESLVEDGVEACGSIDQVFCHPNVPNGFVLRRVDAKGLTDTRTPWLTRSFGSTIPCSSQTVDLLEDETIAIDWDVQVLQDYVDMDLMKGVDQHSSVAKNNALDNGPVPLSHCLDAFTSEEKIQEGYCSSCRQHHEMTKKLEIWRLPPVMVIQLKRFQYTQTYRRKLASLVQFPVHGLDLSSCVAPFEEFPARYPEKAPQPDSTPSEAPTATDVEITQNRMRRGYTNTNLEQSRCLETHYDMYGVVNHQGALGGGHYTAYAKNRVDGNWYSYDDDRVRLIEESKVVTSSAYLCFYVRKDMDDLTVDTIFPPKKDGKITEEDINRFVEESDKGRCVLM
ncbi:ubiquitin-specific protease [Thraustotheca clavata]|uniref:ubiquitinyl hydrolase 1 n=1 Tax=Thraustotheca clavata TaxID=74557 RepID=A0A1V9Y7N2_9STRA|nr:ubiquitin-specific protease [Thraustotheca clavata]